ncbi:MAG: 2-keto-4-pentenoate hydratase [Cryobacterium sp.]|nr:2-keto-4-pentenoate hydratase [Cryobacterium sp.]
MNDDEISRFANQLLEAYDTRAPIPPITDEAPNASVNDAYAVQLSQVERWLEQGRRISGFKVGLTSRAMQRQLGVDSPDFGHLFDDMVLDGAAPIPLDWFIAPRIEPEISFVLGSDLVGPGLVMTDLLRAIDYAIASVEIIDSRIADWRIGLVDTIADNASSGALVLGSRAIAVNDIDLALVGNTLSRNGDIVTTGAGAAVLGHPLNGALFLANTLGSLGRALPAGSIVMAGALSASVPIAPGDTFVARFSSLGDLTVRFSSLQSGDAS